jgi:hypothetical protein
MTKAEVTKLLDENLGLRAALAEHVSTVATLKHEVESKKQVIQMQSANYGDMKRKTRCFVTRSPTKKRNSKK